MTKRQKVSSADWASTAKERFRRSDYYQSEYKQRVQFMQEWFRNRPGILAADAEDQFAAHVEAFRSQPDISLAEAEGAFRAHEARLGNATPLAIQVVTGQPLTREERRFIYKLLEANNGRRGKAKDRELRQFMMTQMFEMLVAEGNLKKQAIGIIGDEFGGKKTRAVRYAMRPRKRRPPR